MKPPLPYYQIALLALSVIFVAILVGVAFMGGQPLPPIDDPEETGATDLAADSEKTSVKHPPAGPSAENPAQKEPPLSETPEAIGDVASLDTSTTNDEVVEKVSEEAVVIENPPMEKTGGVGTPAKRMPDLDQVPDKVVTDCEMYFPRDLEIENRITAMDGPIKAGFSVEVNGLVIPWSLMTFPIMPGETLDVNIVDGKEDTKYQLVTEGQGTVLEEYGQFLKWVAPTDPGIICVRILEEGTEQTICLHMAVMQPWDGVSEELDGYKIGTYQDKPYKENPRYRKPRGFIRITEKEANAWLSPHFQVKQFLCKQQASYPRFMLVEPRLLLKMEMLIERLQQKGVAVDSLYITSAYRTPWYNKALGNKTIYSRHLYGDAADLFVDMNRNGKLDDLDLDGDVDGHDAKVIHKTVEEITGKYDFLKGGLGLYSHPRYNTPFIHIDTRGYPARWYKLPDPPKKTAANTR